MSPPTVYEYASFGGNFGNNYVIFLVLYAIFQIRVQLGIIVVI